MGQTFNEKYYASLLKQLWGNIKPKRRGENPIKARALFHANNASVHKSVIAMVVFEHRSLFVSFSL